MYSFLIVIYVLVCFFMVIIVLLQQGKGSGMGAAFGGGGQTLFGSRGQTTPLQKITTIMAFLFMSLSVVLATMSGGADSDLYEPPAKPGEEVGLQPAAGSMGADQPAEKSDDKAAPTADDKPSADAKPADEKKADDEKADDEEKPDDEDEANSP
jgi:preprotein translocase subunit SecG